MKKDGFWYQKPAGRWNEALPLGNGRLGCMVWGGSAEEKIQVDESSFWSGAPSEENNRTDTKEILWKIREQLLLENYEEADRLGHDFVGNKNQYGTNMPVGNLLLSVEGVQGETTDYTRSLDLAEGIARTKFCIGGISFIRETFVSNPAQVVILRMTGSESFDVRLHYKGIGNDAAITGILPDDFDGGSGVCCCHITGNARERLHSDGTCGVHLEGCLIAECDGTICCDGKEILARDCTDLVCYLDLETDMFLNNPRQTAHERVKEARQKGYGRLKEEHATDVKPMYERVTLSLGGEEKNMLPTDERIAEVAAGGEDPDLSRLMFQYGRYLLIASSRQDSPLPTHMGGIWNDDIYNNIDCTQDMHIDMNLQMQYWAAAQCGLPECYTPFFKYLEDIIVPSGQKTARQVYSANGWTAHVVTNPWGFTSLGWSYNWGAFSLGGVWCALLVWDCFTYTNDRDWLAAHGMALIEGAAQFAADYVFFDAGSGYYMTGPSYSPENMFSAGGKDYFLSLSTTCDVILVREILEVYEKACAALARDGGTLAKRGREIREKLPPCRIGRYGQLQEWFHDFEEPIPNHRHTSHLLGLYPFRQIIPERDAELAGAAEKSLSRRHENFEITSWGMNMFIGYCARLGKAEAAADRIREIFQRIVKPNMTAVMSDETSMWCGTWELDGNTGLTSAIGEMLIQSFEGELILLPALPDAWKDGAFTGMGVKGGHRASLTWKDQKPVELILFCGRDESLKVAWRDRTVVIQCRKGRNVVLRQGW